MYVIQVYKYVFACMHVSMYTSEHNNNLLTIMNDNATETIATTEMISWPIGDDDDDAHGEVITVSGIYSWKCSSTSRIGYFNTPKQQIEYAHAFNLSSGVILQGNLNSSRQENSSFSVHLTLTCGIIVYAVAHLVSHPTTVGFSQLSDFM